MYPKEDNNAFLWDNYQFDIVILSNLLISKLVLPSDDEANMSDKRIVWT